MKVNIYYGGRGLMDDPTLFVINKMQSVLEELNVKVERFMLCELKNTITTLPQTLKDRRYYPGNNSGMVWYWRIYAAIP